MGFTRPASTRMVAVTGFSPANERRPVRYAHYSVYRGISYARQTNQLFYIRIRNFLHIAVQSIFIKDNLPGSDQSGHSRLLRIDILLGSPLQQVGRMGSTPYFSAGGELPPAIPTSVFRFSRRGLIILFSDPQRPKSHFR